MLKLANRFSQVTAALTSLSSSSSHYTTTSASNKTLKTTNRKRDISKMAEFDMNVEKKELIERYNSIKSKITDPNVCLVAVSKTKPTWMIRALYEQGHRYFGENYIQELESKSVELEDLAEIKWHFIGSVQSNKIKGLCIVKHLAMVETVEKVAAADKFAKSWTDEHRQLPIMVQVNTSGEESKSGCDPSHVVDIVRHITSNDVCKKSLRFAGLMTIGSPNAGVDQPDFKKLVQCREMVSQQLGLPVNEIGLSMGMSHDYLEAIQFGSTCVRVGSAIFGERDYSKH